MPDMRPDPDAADYAALAYGSYDDLNYGRSLSGLMLARSHDVLEAAFDETVHFGRVVEVGAGSGQHVGRVRHRYDSYTMTDLSTDLLDRAKMRLPERERIRVEIQDATRLDCPDASFDRLIAAHVLEHLPAPHEVLREWNRVVRPGGTISILLPCDPGLLWRLGRCLGPRRNATRKGVPYDYVMAREHINSIVGLRALIAYYFTDIRESWYPARIPSIDLNLFYACHVTV